MPYNNNMQNYPTIPYRAFDVVAIGASLGGLAALQRVLLGLPADFPIPVVVVQHLSARFPSHLAELLDRHSPVRVEWAAHGALLKPGRVYVAPPDRHTLVGAHGHLALTHTDPVQFSRPSVTRLFESIAQVYGERGLGVVLTGRGTDGAEGTRRINKQGGRVLVQDPQTATAASMPLAALRTGCTDFVLPLPYIPAALVALVMAPGGAALFRVPPRPAV